MAQVYTNTDEISVVRVGTRVFKLFWSDEDNNRKREYVIGCIMNNFNKLSVKTISGGDSIDDTTKNEIENASLPDFEFQEEIAGYIITEFDPNYVTLSEWLSKREQISLDVIKTFAFQMSWILSQMHAQYGIQHEDLYEKNILVREIKVKETITYVLNDRDRFELILDIGHLHVRLFDYGASRLRTDTEKATKKSKTWKTPSLNAFPFSNDPAVFMTEDWEEGYSVDAYERKHSQSDMYMFGYVLLNMYAHKRFDTFEYKELSGIQVYNTKQDSVISTITKDIFKIDPFTAEDENPFFLKNNIAVLFGTALTNDQILDISERWMLNILAIRYMFIEDLSPPIYLGPKTKEYYSKAVKNKTTVDYIKTTYSKLGSALKEDGLFNFIKKLIDFNPDTRIGFGRDATKFKFGLAGALLNPFFAGIYKERSATKITGDYNGIFKPPLEYANDKEAETRRTDVENFATKCEKEFNPAPKSSAVTKVKPKPAAPTEWSLERFKKLRGQGIKELDKADVAKLTDDLIDQSKNIDKIIALAKVLDPTVKTTKDLKKAKADLKEAIKKYKSGLKGGGTNVPSGGGGEEDDHDNSDTSDQDNQPPPAVVTPAAIPKQQQPSPAATPKKQPESGGPPASSTSTSESTEDVAKKFPPAKLPTVVDDELHNLFEEESDLTLLFGRYKDAKWLSYPVNTSHRSSEFYGLMQMLSNLDVYKNAKTRNAAVNQSFVTHIKDLFDNIENMNIGKFNDNVIKPLKTILDRGTLIYPDGKEYSLPMKKIVQAGKVVEIMDNNGKVVYWCTEETQEAGRLLPPRGVNDANGKRDKTKDLLYQVRLADLWGQFIYYILRLLINDADTQTEDALNSIKTKHDNILNPKTKAEYKDKRETLILKAIVPVILESAIWDRAEEYIETIPAVAAAYTNLELHNKTLTPLNVNHVEQREFDRRVAILDTMIDRIEASGGNGTFSSADAERIDFFTPFTTSWRHKDGSIQDL